MAATPRGTGEAPASLLTLLSLNTARRGDLGGLSALLRQHHPAVVFLQEVGPYAPLSSLAQSLGYQVFLSAHQARGSVAVLSRLPGAAVAVLRPGYAQLLTIGGLSFIHLHAPSGAFQEREALFTSLRPHFQGGPIPPVLVRRRHLLPFPSALPGPGRSCC